MSTAVKLSSPETREFWEIPILFEDEHLLALDKPSGLLTSPDPLTPQRPSLMQLSHAAIAAGKPWAQERKLDYLTEVNQLDADATGVLLLAKNKAAFVALADEFGSDKPVRTYIALVQGVPPNPDFVIDEKIGPHPVREGLMRVDSRGGKKSKTEFIVAEDFGRWSLVRCVPRIERLQQIRVHLQYAHFPVVADEFYGGKKLWLSRLKPDFRLKPGRDERPLLARPALHLEELNFPHPVTQAPLKIRSEWPKDIRVAVKYLRLYTASGAGRGRVEDPGLEDAGLDE